MASGSLNRVPLVEYLRRDQPQYEHSYRQDIRVRKQPKETVM